MPNKNNITFFYGCVSCAKSAFLLIDIYNSESKGSNVFLMKPCIDTRSGPYISSRAGLKRKADYLITENTDITKINLPDSGFIYIDEVQFLSKKHIEQLYELSDRYNIKMFGLLTDYKTIIFDASKRIIELGINNIKFNTKCQYCDDNADCNLKTIKSNKLIELGYEELYVPTCYKCYVKYNENTDENYSSEYSNEDYSEEDYVESDLSKMSIDENA